MKIGKFLIDEIYCGDALQFIGFEIVPEYCEFTKKRIL